MRLGMNCPHCQRRAQIRTSVALTPTLRNVYFLCENVACGHSWVATLEAVRTISPSGIPNPAINLPVMERCEVEEVFDLLRSGAQRTIFEALRTGLER
ncbi:ogr/Delta-like zinc finger family protein [Alcaligenaceae bacterium SJ-26]|nr:ogr/Delta-like zinc finger family protein [Alcaligenaceae bacterium SJ-26]